jgi:hypothetical protein
MRGNGDKVNPHDPKSANQRAFDKEEVKSGRGICGGPPAEENPRECKNSRSAAAERVAESS